MVVEDVCKTDVLRHLGYCLRHSGYSTEHKAGVDEDVEDERHEEREAQERRRTGRKAILP